MEEGSLEERLSFRIVDVHLSDEFSTIFSRKTFFRAGEDNDGEGAAAGGGNAEALQESVLQMSKLGLPTSFSSAPRRSSHRSRSHRKSRSDDQVTPSLVSVNTSVKKSPFPVDSVQVSIEDAVVSKDQSKCSAVANTLASTPASIDENANDGQAIASSCGAMDATSAPVQIFEVAGNIVSALGGLLLNREPIGCERPNMSNMVMAQSVEMMGANNNVSNYQEEGLGKDGCTIPNGEASFVDEENSPMNSINLSVVDIMAFDDFARREGIGVRVENMLADVVEPEDHAEDAQISDVGAPKWSACWDAYYGRYYFYHAETKESTWEPPEGFETYASIPFVQVSNEDNVTDGISTDFVAEKKKVFLEQDIQSVVLLHGASCAEGTLRSSKDDGIAERVAEGVDLLTVSNNVALLGDASMSITDVEHEEIEGSRLLLVEAGTIADCASCPQSAMEIDNVQVKGMDSQIAMKIDNVQVKEIEPSVQEIFGSDPKSACLEDLKWAACWDDYYGRYYFHNAETSESTWERPKGFEAFAYKESNKMPNVTSNGEATLSNESKVELTLEDSSNTGSLRQVVEIVSSSTDSKYQELCSAKESEEQVVFDLKDPACQEVSNVTTEGGIVHVDLANCKVAVVRKRAKKAAHFLLQLANQHVDAAVISPNIFKYWFQRFHLFSKYESGIKLDEEGWFSVTPEAIAKHQAARCKGGVIVDAFTGVGGNAIQFALAGHHVVAIDNDPKRIDYAHHNAMVYGVADRIDFVLGDFFTVSSSMQADVIFLSPPWGGPDYLDAAVYDILTMLQPKDGVTLLNMARLVAPNIILFLPRNVDMNQLAKLLKTLSFSCSCEVERNFLNGKLKAVTVYYGQFENMVELSS